MLRCLARKRVFGTSHETRTRTLSDWFLRPERIPFRQRSLIVGLAVNVFARTFAVRLSDTCVNLCLHVAAAFGFHASMNLVVDFFTGRCKGCFFYVWFRHFDLMWTTLRE